MSISCGILYGKYIFGMHDKLKDKWFSMLVLLTTKLDNSSLMLIVSLQGNHYTASLVDTCTDDDCVSSSQLDKLSAQKRHKLSSPLLCSLLTGIQKLIINIVCISTGSRGTILRLSIVIQFLQ